MSFFEPPPEPEEDEGNDWPDWTDPPDDELGVLIPVERVVAENERALVAARAVVAYSNGFSLTVVGRHRVDRDPDADPLSFHEEHFRAHDPRSEHFLRLGLLFADGSRATNLDHEWPGEDDAEPEAPTLFGHPDVDPGTVTLRYWVYPLPPPGPLTLVCEWPAHGIPETRLELDTALILDAAARPVPIRGQ